MNMRKTLSVLCACLCLCVSLAAVMTAFTACTPAASGTDPAADGVIRIVCTTFPAFEFARMLTEGQGTDEVRFEVTMLSSRGQDLHNFQPSAADIRTLASADVFVCVGGTSEAWVDKAVASAKNDALTTVAMMKVCEAMVEELPEGAEAEEEHDDDATEVEYDEHIWTSFGNAAAIIDAIAGAVKDKLTDQPALAAAVADKQSVIKGTLSDLHGRYTDMIAAAKRHAVVIADRFPFAYLFRELGLTVYAAFPGCSAETQASFATQVFLVGKTQELSLPAVFTVDNGAGSVASTVSQETGAQVLRLWSGQTIPDDGMTYLEMLEENLRNLTIALN